MNDIRVFEFKRTAILNEEEEFFERLSLRIQPTLMSIMKEILWQSLKLLL